MTEFMRSTDAFTWAMESDPRLRSTVVTVLLLEKSPDWDDVCDRIDLVTRKLPMFRQCVVNSPAPFGRTGNFRYPITGMKESFFEIDRAVSRGSISY